MIPGTAVGVLVGDLIFTAMAFRLARRTGRADVTAMPLGLDTPSTFGAVFLILGPAFLAARSRGLDADDAAREAWFVGIAMILASGMFKLACSTFSGLIRRMVPRAGLLGSLTAIALVLISFLPLIDIASQPDRGDGGPGGDPGDAHRPMEAAPEIPGALAAVMVGCVVYYAMNALRARARAWAAARWPGPRRSGRSCRCRSAEWFEWFRGSLADGPGVSPGGDPARAGDGRRRDRLHRERGVGRRRLSDRARSSPAKGSPPWSAALFGGVIQSTPYIGHPAYKAMGARAAYTLATALFVGGGGVFGYFDWIFYLLPKAGGLADPDLRRAGDHRAVVPRDAGPALPGRGLGCVPALAYLAARADQVLPFAGPFEEFPEPTRRGSRR